MEVLLIFEDSYLCIHFEGIRVIDLTRVLAGPWCTQLLASLGAEVIKIENPSSGDDTRKWGAPWVKDRSGIETEDAAYFCAVNRNKSSVTIDLKSVEGLDIVQLLVEKSDILVENFKVGSLDKLGLGYEDLKQINPQLIYVSITGFGQTGPLADQPGYDYLIQGLGGLMSITGCSDGEPGGGPQCVGVPIVDINTEFYATVGVLAALLQRQATGRGQHIDLALLDSHVGWLVNQAMNYLIGGEVSQRTGNSHPNLVPYQSFKTSDGDIIIAVGNDRQFQSLCQFIDCVDWSADPKFITNATRIAHRQDIVDGLQQKIIEKPNRYWLQELPTAGVPCSVINNIQQVFNHPQVKARNMKVSLPHKQAGELDGVANPLKFSDAQIKYNNTPPTLGENTNEVLGRILEMDAQTIASLAEKNVI